MLGAAGFGRKSFFGSPRSEGQDAMPYLDGAIIVPGSATFEIRFDRWQHLYSNFLIFIPHILPTADASALLMRVSSDGAVYDAGAAQYSYGTFEVNSAGTTATAGADNTAMNLTSAGIGNVSAEGAHGSIVAFRTTDGNLEPKFESDFVYMDSSVAPRFTRNFGGGLRRISQVTRSVQLFFSGTTIAAGEWALYGIRTFRSHPNV